MAKKVPIDTFVSELAAALNRGDGYIMAAYGQNPRTGSLDLKETKVSSAWRENGWYYTQYSGSQRAQALKWRKNCARVWDCNGLAEGIYELHTGVCINARARNNYASWCSVKGSGMIPASRRVPGAAVFWSGSGAGDIHHVAYLWKPVTAGRPEGDWYLIEARGVMYGVVKSKLLSRRPNYWGWMDRYFDYGSAAVGTGAAPAGEGQSVRIEGGDCYVRDAPNTAGRILGVARRGDALPYGGSVDAQTRWLAVRWKGGTAWVSGKYGRLAS